MPKDWQVQVRSPRARRAPRRLFTAMYVSQAHGWKWPGDKETQRSSLCLKLMMMRKMRSGRGEKEGKIEDFLSNKSHYIILQDVASECSHTHPPMQTHTQTKKLPGKGGVLQALCLVSAVSAVTQAPNSPSSCHSEAGGDYAKALSRTDSCGTRA